MAPFNTGLQRASLDITFDARVLPDPGGNPKLFAVDLYADGMPTRVRLDGLTKEAAVEQGEHLVADALEVMQHFGIWTEVYARSYAKKAFELTGLRVGDLARLREDAAGLKAGHLCQIERIDLTADGGGVDGLCPVVVRPLSTSEGMIDVLLPLNLDELEKF